MAMKGRHWEHDKHAPDPVLKGYLTKKANSVKRRILDATGVTVELVCYGARYTEDDEEKQNPYNLSNLLYNILITVPTEKRLVLVDKLNEDDENWSQAE